MSPGTPRAARGFTLIELAVVVAIVGLLLGGLLLPLATQVEITHARTTAKQIADLRDALYGFAVAAGRLPCPDTDGDGRENLTAGDCTAAQGQPPWADLGTDQVDDWGRPFLYRVSFNTTTSDHDFSDTTDGTGCGSPTAGISFELCSEADIKVLATAGGATVAEKLPAVFLSFGTNGGDTASFSTDEQENNDNDGIFVDKDYESGFDDLVGWLSPHVLKAMMVRAERLP